MTELAEALCVAGLVPEGLVVQARRWGAVLPELTGLEAEPDVATLCAWIEEALQGPHRETDLDAVHRYVVASRPAELRVRAEDGFVTIAVEASPAPGGVWVMPWRSDGISELLTDGESHLAEGGKRYYFREVRELFYGSTKAFVACVTSTIEEDDDTVG